MKITKKNLLRFSKQIILKKIGISGQKKIFSSKVLVVGAGGLGCPLILYLANSGVGNIGIIDDDKIEITNLNRQILFTPKDLGKYKVSQAKKFVNIINADIEVKIYKKRLDKTNIIKIFNEYDIICDGTDNYITRYLINDHCLKSKKILISAAISKFNGHIFNFNFKKKVPCFRCFMPVLPDNEDACETEGVISTLAGIAGTLQANEVINTIINKNNNLESKMLIIDSFNSNIKKVTLTKNSNCINKCGKR